MPRKRLTRADKVMRKLKAAQQEQGYTQEDIAEVFGVSRQIVSKWYKDIDHMQYGKARRLLRILGLDMGEINAIE